MNTDSRLMQPNLTAGPIPSAAVTSPETGTCPASISASGVQATASVVPSGSRTTGSPSATVAANTRCTPWKSSSRPCGAVPVKCSSCTPRSSPTIAVRPDSSATSRAAAAAGRSPWSTPPPGRLQLPGCGPRAELRVSRIESSRRTRAYAANRCRIAGWWRASAWRTIGTVGTFPDSTSATGCQRASTVEPSTSTTRGSGASAGTQASYTIRTECSSEAPSSPWLPVSRWRCAEPIQIGRPSSQLRPVSSCTSRTTAASGCSPKSIPPPGSVHCSFSEIDGAIRASRMSPPRTIRAYAATRWRRGSCVGSSDMGASLGTASARYFVRMQDALERPAPTPAPPPVKQRDPWFDNAKMALIVLVVLGHAWTLLPSQDRLHSWTYDFLYSWHVPAFVIVTGYLSKSFEYTRPADVVTGHDRGAALRDLRGSLRVVPPRGRWRGVRAVVGQPALADVVPRRIVLLAAGDARPEANARQGRGRSGDQPAGRHLRERHPRQRTDPRPAAVLRARAEDARGPLEPAPRQTSRGGTASRCCSGCSRSPGSRATGS